MRSQGVERLPSACKLGAQQSGLLRFWSTETNKTKPMTHELHPLCTLFPRLVDFEFLALVADIAANGLRQPIVMHDGMILDGGNRYRACIEAGVEPSFVEFTGDSIVGFVLSANLHRRHLTPGQQAAIMASAQDWAKAQTHGGDRKTDQAATLPLESIKDRAAQSGAGERTQRMADKVAKADPDLARRVAHGEISLPKAHASISPKKEPKIEAQEIADVASSGQKPRIDDDEVPYLREALAAAQQAASEALEENTRIGALLDADDRTAALHAENKKLMAEVKVLQQRVYGLQNERNEAVRAAKSWQRKATQAA